MSRQSLNPISLFLLPETPHILKKGNIAPKWGKLGLGYVRFSLLRRQVGREITLKLLSSYLTKQDDKHPSPSSVRVQESQLKDYLKVMNMHTTTEVMQYPQAVAEGYFYL